MKMPEFIVRTYLSIESFEKALNQRDGYTLHSFSYGAGAMIAVFVLSRRRK
jgi:hypothetical protein